MQDKPSAGRPTVAYRAASPFSGGQRTQGYVNPTYSSNIFVAAHESARPAPSQASPLSHRRLYSSRGVEPDSAAGVRSDRVSATRTPHRYAVPAVSGESGAQSQLGARRDVSPIAVQSAVETASPQLFRSEQAPLHEFLQQTEIRKREIEARSQAVKEEAAANKKLAALERSREKEAKASYKASLDAQVVEYNRGRSKEIGDPSTTGLAVGEREAEHTPFAKKQRQQAIKSTLEQQIVERIEQQHELEFKHRQELAESDFLRYKQRLDKAEKNKCRKIEELVARSVTPPPSKAQKEELEHRRVREEQHRQQEKLEDKQLLSMVVEFNNRKTQEEAVRRQHQKAELAEVLTRQIEERNSPAKEAHSHEDGGVFVVTLPRPVARPPTQTDMIGKATHAPVLKPKVFTEKAGEASSKQINQPKSKTPVQTKSKVSTVKSSAPIAKKK